MKVVLGMPLGDFILALITGIATLTALFIGISTLIQSATLRKKEFKARLLDELKTWALDFQNTNIPTIPTISDLEDAPKLETHEKIIRLKKEKMDLMAKLVSIFFEATYIRELAAKVFETDLEDTFKRIDTEIVSMSFLLTRDTNTPFAANPISAEVIKKLEESLKNGNKSIDVLFNEHRQLLTHLLHELLTKIADTKAKLQ